MEYRLRSRKCLTLRVLALRTEEPIGLDGVSMNLGDPSRVELNQLRIGMYTDIGDIRCAPAMRRAVEDAAESLRKNGATVEPFAPPGVAEAWEIYMRFFYADGLSHVKQALKRSKRDWRIKQCTRFAIAPSWMRPSLASLSRCWGNSISDVHSEYSRIASRRRPSTSNCSIASNPIDSVSRALCRPEAWMPSSVHPAPVQLFPTASSMPTLA